MRFTVKKQGRAICSVLQAVKTNAYAARNSRIVVPTDFGKLRSTVQKRRLRCP